jgi:hypothetical protein
MQSDQTPQLFVLWSRSSILSKSVWLSVIAMTVPCEEDIAEMVGIAELVVGGLGKDVKSLLPEL